MTAQQQPWVTVMLEARLADLLKSLRSLPPKLVNERLLCDLHRETERLLRHLDPGDYEGGRPCDGSAPNVKSGNQSSSHPAGASSVIDTMASVGSASEPS